jgi:hypothetical protein
MLHSDMVCRTLFEPKRLTFPARSGADGNQVIPVTAVFSSANRAQGIFWRISVESRPIVLGMSAYPYQEGCFVSSGRDAWSSHRGYQCPISAACMSD